jgi:hypothetical protein
LGQRSTHIDYAYLVLKFISGSRGHLGMNKFDTDTERVFRERVVVKTFDLKYVEKGEDYIRFRDPASGKLYEVSVKEKKTK